MIILNTEPPRIFDTEFLDYTKWVSVRTQASFDLPCASCGSSPTELHHIKHVRKEKFSLINPENAFEKMSFIRNRRQVPLCKDCHNKIHSGEYSGEGLKTLYDNRIFNSENYITYSKHLSPDLTFKESLIDKGWTKPKNN